MPARYKKKLKPLLAPCAGFKVFSEFFNTSRVFLHVVKLTYMSLAKYSDVLSIIADSSDESLRNMIHVVMILHVG